MVIRDQDQPLDAILASMKKHQEALLALQDLLVTRAKLQSYTEKQFNDLAQVAREGIELVGKVQAGDVVQPDWIAERDTLVNSARRLISDV
ncbi:MAG TPA: hypothetical protein VKR06_20510 [Ktedonosporobacter sp.]|nr:hypothetical protein [Ktedonosporobacter sp.]